MSTCISGVCLLLILKSFQGQYTCKRSPGVPFYLPTSTLAGESLRRLRPIHRRSPINREMSTNIFGSLWDFHPQEGRSHPFGLLMFESNPAPVHWRDSALAAVARHQFCQIGLGLPAL